MASDVSFNLFYIIEDSSLQENILQDSPQMDLSPVGRLGGKVHPEIEATIQGLRGDGQPLEGALRNHMGASLGHDFSEVQVHTSPEADLLNRRLSSSAFTIGSDIFFAQDMYKPQSWAGRELIAHELIHVVQRQRSDRPGMSVCSADDPLEKEANALATVVAGMQGEQTRPMLRSGSTEQAMVYRALAGQVKEIPSLSPFPSCHNATVWWIYNEMSDTPPKLLDALWMAMKKINKLVLNGSAIKYEKHSSITISAGDVIVFYNGEAKHSCIALSQQEIGGYNQADWFTGGIACKYTEHKLSDMNGKKKKNLGNPNYKCCVYKISADNALKVAGKDWSSIQ